MSIATQATIKLKLEDADRCEVACRRWADENDRRAEREVHRYRVAINAYLAAPWYRSLFSDRPLDPRRSRKLGSWTLPPVCDEIRDQGSAWRQLFADIAKELREGRDVYVSSECAATLRQWDSSE